MEKKNSESLRIDSITTVSKMVYDKLLKAIVSGNFKPGQRLPERELSKEMGISRTPIREAFKELQTQGLVRTIPYKGVEVTMLSKKEALDVINVCIALERVIARSAAENANNINTKEIEENLIEYKNAMNKKDYFTMKELNHEFHNLISMLCDNDLAIRFYQTARASMALITQMTFDYEKRDEDTHSEHEELLNAIKSGDVNLAESKAVEHIEQVKKVVLKFEE